MSSLGQPGRCPRCSGRELEVCSGGWTAGPSTCQAARRTTLIGIGSRCASRGSSENWFGAAVSDDVEAIVRDNAASLRIMDFGFEGE
jgi:hypothetical protein